ncbi:MAG TPA: class I SAM-dependent methyltransferase [Acidimicrobiales bacterium]|nr:class I SAM-dependent methyltransferase [Acidimicrobiales bacterium]
MTANPRAAFFDGIADKWDGWEDLEILHQRMASGLREVGLGAGETVLDVGCGTGNLTLALLDQLSPAGRVHAVDLSRRMIEVARAKVADDRVSWHVEDARRLPLAAASCDRVLCFSVWPHFEDRRAVTTELMRILRPGGSLHVWHLSGRQRINEIHATAGEAVRGDVLPPAGETADLLAAMGLRVTAAVDAADRYLVTAVKDS